MSLEKIQNLLENFLAEKAGVQQRIPPNLDIPEVVLAPASVPAQSPVDVNRGFYSGSAGQAVAAFVKEVTSTPEVALAPVAAVSESARTKVAANGGFFIGPARQALAAVVEDETFTPKASTESVPAVHFESEVTLAFTLALTPHLTRPLPLEPQPSPHHYTFACPKPLTS